MKVLMLSTDENIFKAGSESQSRMKDYATLVDELHIIVLTARNFQFPISNFQTNPKFQISENTFVYSAFSTFKLWYLIHACKISSSIIRNLKFGIRNCVITCQDPFETGLVGYWLKKKYKLPLQIQVHTDFLSPYFWRESMGNKVKVILGRWFVKKVEGLRVVSERIKKSILQTTNYKLQTNISVLPIFIDVQKIKESPIHIDLRRKYPGRFIILMASRLTREKNIGLAIESARNLIPNHPNLLLLIVGSGPESENLKSQVTSYKLQDFVFFEPWCDDLPSYYKTADLFLLTSNYEGYGRTAVEATAAGLPVVMTDVGVAIGLAAPVGDKKKLIEKINLLIGNKEERNKILESQKDVLSFYNSKEDYLSKIKKSWENCFL